MREKGKADEVVTFKITVQLSKVYVFFVHICEHWYVLRSYTYRCDDTRGCIVQFGPPDDEHMVLETCRSMK